MNEKSPKNNSKKPFKKPSSSSDKSKRPSVNKKFTSDNPRNAKRNENFKPSERGSFRKPSSKPNFFGMDRDNSDSPKRSFRSEDKKNGERKPFNRDRAPRREGGEERGERKPFNRDRAPRREGGEERGERRPFNRDRAPRREGGEERGERRPFNRDRAPRREGGERGERKPFNRDRAPRREGGEERGERKPFNRDRAPRREGGEERGERRPFNRDRAPRREGGEERGERKPFNRDRAPRREGGEDRGERRPFNRDRAPRREGGEERGERQPFNRDRAPRREGGEERGERKPFNRDRAPRREGGEDRGERRPFNRDRAPRREGGEERGERKPFFNRDWEERPKATFDGEELVDAPPEKREVRRYKINPEEMQTKKFPKTNKKIKVRKDKEEEILENEELTKGELLSQLKENSLLGDARNYSDGEEQTVFRINRFLAKCGLGARRDVESLIISGKIKVNGEVESSLSRKIDVNKDVVEYEGTKVELISDNSIIALNKPAGYLCSHHDVHHEKTVFNLLPLKYKKLNMAGRLDLTSRGLMIFSANGEILNQISHPSYDVKKRYLVQVDKPIQESDFVETFLKGIEDEGEFLRAKEVSILDPDTNTISIILQEGKKRQIHRMFRAIGYKVIDLQRVQIGKLLLDDLDIPEGKFKEVSVDDIF